MKKIFTFSFIFLCTLAVTASAEVYLNDFTYYERDAGSSVSFCKTDIKNPDEYGIIYSAFSDELYLSSKKATAYKGKLISSDGSFGIMLKDPDKKLGEVYYVRAYAIKNGEVSYSENIRKVNMKAYHTSIDKISEILPLLEPGDEVYLTDGEYEDFDIDISVNGTSYNPIKIKSETNGNVVLKGDSNIIISGDYIELSGLLFEECRSTTPIVSFIGATGSRLSESAFYKSGDSELATRKLISLGDTTRNCRVDHNYFEDLYAIGIGIEATAATDSSNVCSGNRIDNNYFLDVAAVGDRFPGQTNGFECIQLGTEYREGTVLGTIVENNRFENVTGDGSEIISNKSNGNNIRNNTFLNSNSGLTLRTGNDCIVSGNIFINTSKGIIVYGSGHMISDNYMYNSAGVYLNCGNSIDSTWGDYKRPSDITINNNMIIYPHIGGIILGRYFSEDELRTYRPKNIKVTDNYFVLNNYDAAIDYIGVKDISYVGNKYAAHGAGTLGSAYSDGFSKLDKALIFDGDLYIPSAAEVKKDGYMRLLKDIWWIDIAAVNTDKIDNTEPDEEPVSFELPSLPYNYFSYGEKVDIRGITGTAIYANGESYAIPSDKIQYTFNQGSTSSTLNGYILSSKSSSITNTYSSQVIYTYKGKSVSQKFYAVPDLKNANGEITTEGFKNMNYISFLNGKSAYWDKLDGAFSNNQINGQEMGIIFTGSYTDYDYVFSSDITITKSGSYPVNAKLYFGYSPLPNNKYYYLQFGENQGIYGSDGKLGELNYSFKDGVSFNIKIAVKDGMVSVSADDKLIGNAGVSISPYGKFGLCVNNTYLTAKCCSISHNNSVSSDTAVLNTNVSAVDSNVIELSFPDGTEDEIIRICKDDEYIAQVRGNEKYYDVNVLVGKNYEYSCTSYNAMGAKVSSSTKSYKITEEIADSFFRIDNVKVRSGNGGEYVDEYYSHRNMFLREGLYPYKDRVYHYTYIPEELLNSGYIKTCNSDRTNPVFTTQCDDWLTFTINRSATVYVAFKNLEGWSLPGWLKDWKKEDMRLSISEQPDAVNVYSYHFDVKDNEKLTIKLGSFKAISAMYEVIIKPDVMPLEYKLLNYSPTIL